MSVAREQKGSVGLLDPPIGASLIEMIEARTPGDSRLKMCIQCGTCGGSCPSGPDMDHTPRQLFAMLRAGLEDAVLESNTAWYCVSCYLCTVRCPQDIKITDIMYTLKTVAISRGKAQVNPAKDWSQTFVGYVEQYGRSFEFGLATRHNLRYMPTGVGGAATLGLGLLSKGRMDMTPIRIQGTDKLRAILKRARELEAEL